MTGANFRNVFTVLAKKRLLSALSPPNPIPSTLPVLVSARPSAEILVCLSVACCQGSADVLWHRDGHGPCLGCVAGIDAV